MAKDIEIPLNVAFSRKSVKLLKATQAGAFILLSRAALLDDFDPFNALPADIMFYARLTPNQWIKCRERIMFALKDALPVLRAAYDKAFQKRVERAIRTKRALSGSWDKRRLAKQARVNAMLPADSFLSDTTSISFSQPLKAQAHTSTKTDLQARKIVQKAKTSNPKDVWLPPTK